MDMQAPDKIPYRSTLDKEMDSVHYQQQAEKKDGCGFLMALLVFGATLTGAICHFGWI